jgi:hypothetical protein
MMNICQANVPTSVSDLDWIRIKSGQWIRSVDPVRIRNLDPDRIRNLDPQLNFVFLIFISSTTQTTFQTGIYAGENLVNVEQVEIKLELLRYRIC